jgi:membrane protease YdiL (CAAX protease family)
MFKTLTDTSKAAIFTGLVLILAVAAALAIKALGLTSFLAGMVWSSTPALATAIMLLVVTRDGRSRQGWRSLGLHHLGLRMWCIAFFGTLLITVVASAVVWLTPLASVVVPAFGGVSPIISWLVFQVVVLVLSLSEEIGIRGYLLPKLLPMGRKRALLVSGLVWATWHMPLIFLTSFLPVGNKLIAIPLFYATIIAASFYFGYLRIYSGSVAPHDRARRAQRCVGTHVDAHRDGLPRARQLLPGRRLRHSDRDWCRRRSPARGPTGTPVYR